MENTREAWVKWHVEFVQVDLSKVSEMERGRLASSIELIERSQRLPGQEMPYLETIGTSELGIETVRLYLKNHDRYRLEAIQEFIKPHFDAFTAGLLETKRFLAGGFKVEQVENTPLDPRSKLASLSPNFQLDLRVEWPTPIGGWKQAIPAETVSYQWEPDADREAVIRFGMSAPTPEESVLWHFVWNLEGVPVSALGRCTECGRWFTNFSRRKKEFCTNRCAARYAMRRKRAHNEPENNNQTERRG